jgi:quercetin dioxygenase-like cupin family protein
MTLLLLFGSGADFIEPDSAEHGHLADASAITTTTEVQGLTCFHGQLTDQALVTSTFIQPDDATHSHTADASVIITVISPAECTHSHTADAATSASAVVVSPRECTHGHTADAAPVLGNAQPGDVSVAMEQPTVKTVMLYPTVSADLTELEVLMEVY